MERGFSAKLKTFSKDYMSLVAVIIIFIVFSFASPYFLKMSNVMNIFSADSNRSDCGNWPGNVDHNWSG